MNPSNEAVIVEVINAERHGLFQQRRRYYIRRPNQACVVVVDNNKWQLFCAVIDTIISMFLPRRYYSRIMADNTPHLQYFLLHIFFATVAGTLATLEVLLHIGIHRNAAAPLAAMITWIYRDGFGKFKKIVFSAYQGFMLQANKKQMYVLSQFLIDIAMFIEVNIPLFGYFGVVLLILSALLRATDGIARVTRRSLSTHYAVYRSLADVMAKDAAKETAVKIFASVVGVFVIGLTGQGHSFFYLSLILHMIFSYLSVRSVCLNTLNEARYIIAMESYLSVEFIPKAAEVNALEPILASLAPHTAQHLTYFKISIGSSIEHVNEASSTEVDLGRLERVYNDWPYMLHADMKKKKMYVILKASAYPNTVMCSYFHAVLLCLFICSINDVDLPIFHTGSQNFIALHNVLVLGKWARIPIRYRTNNCLRFEPSEKLLFFTQRVIEVEWPKFYIGVLEAGFVIHRHHFAAGRRLTAEDNEDEEYNHDDDEFISGIDSPTSFDTFFEMLTEAIELRREEITRESSAEPEDRDVRGDSVERENRLQMDELRAQRWAEDNRISRFGTPSPEAQVRPRRV